MSEMPTIMMVKDAQRITVRRTLEMLGHGPNSLTFPLIAADDNTSTYADPALKWMMQYMATLDTDVVQWTAIVNGAAPTVDRYGDPIEWGVSILPYTGVECPSEAEVLAAWGSENVDIIARSTFAEDGDQRPREERPPTPNEWKTETMAQESVKPRPDEPV